MDDAEREAKLARVRAIKERKDAEERQRREKHREETIDRILEAEFSGEENESWVRKNMLWDRVYEYLPYSARGTLRGSGGIYFFEGKEKTKADEFRRSVQEALKGLSKENARDVASQMLDAEEKAILKRSHSPQ